jgi:hypothetical protein
VADPVLRIASFELEQLDFMSRLRLEEKGAFELIACSGETRIKLHIEHRRTDAIGQNRDPSWIHYLQTQINTMLANMQKAGMSETDFEIAYSTSLRGMYPDQDIKEEQHFGIQFTVYVNILAADEVIPDLHQLEDLDTPDPEASAPVDVPAPVPVQIRPAPAPTLPRPAPAPAPRAPLPGLRPPQPALARR